MNFAPFLDHAQRLRTWVKRHSRPLSLAFAAVFGAAILASLVALDLSWSDIDPARLALLILVLAPLGVLLGALNMLVLAGSIDSEMSMRDATRISAFAQLSEILPLPGAAVVRGSVLIDRGARIGQATRLTIASAMLSVGCAALGAGISLGLMTLAGATFALLGAGSIIASMVSLTHDGRLSMAIAALGVRIVGLVLVGVRLTVAFLAIGTAMTLSNAYPFAFAMIFGSASSLAPGGIGISEALAAGMATLSTVPPAAAVLAVAIDRMVSFGASGVVFVVMQLSPRRHAQPTN